MGIGNEQLPTLCTHRSRSGALGRITARSSADASRVCWQRWQPGLGWLCGKWVDSAALVVIEQSAVEVAA